MLSQTPNPPRRGRRVIDRVEEWDDGDYTENSDDEFRSFDFTHLKRSQRFKPGRTRKLSKKDYISHIDPDLTFSNPFLSAQDVANLTSTSRALATQQQHDPSQNCVNETMDGIKCLNLDILRKKTLHVSSQCRKEICERSSDHNLFLMNLLKSLAHGVDVTYGKITRQERLIPQSVTTAHFPFRGLELETLDSNDFSEIFRIHVVGPLIEMERSPNQVLVSTNKENIALFVKKHPIFHKPNPLAENAEFTVIFHNANVDEYRPREEFDNLKNDLEIYSRYKILSIRCANNGLELEKAYCDIHETWRDKVPFIELNFAYPFAR